MPNMALQDNLNPYPWQWHCHGTVMTKDYSGRGCCLSCGKLLNEDGSSEFVVGTVLEQWQDYANKTGRYAND